MSAYDRFRLHLARLGVAAGDIDDAELDRGSPRIVWRLAAAGVRGPLGVGSPDADFTPALPGPDGVRATDEQWERTQSAVVAALPDRLRRAWEQREEARSEAVDLTASELLLLRVRLNEQKGNVSFGAVDPALDAKLFAAQQRVQSAEEARRG